jgi:hypothetical protein
MKVTIQSLRQAGFKVRVLHTRSRRLSKDIKIGFRTVPVNKGGDTRIEITTPDMQTTVVGIAKCSLKDSYNRKLGNEIALGRALTEFQENHPAVSEIINSL